MKYWFMQHLANITVSEKNEITHTVWFYLFEMFKTGRSRETECGLVVVRGFRGKWMWLLMGTDFLFGVENILKLWWELHNSATILKPLNCTLYISVLIIWIIPPIFLRKKHRRKKILDTLGWTKSKNHKRKNLINWNFSKLRIRSSKDTVKQIKKRVTD